MSFDSRNFRKLLVKENKDQKDNYLLGVYFMIYGEECGSEDTFDTDQAIIYFKKVIKEKSDLTPLGYYGLVLSEYNRDPESKMVPVLIRESLFRDKKFERTKILEKNFDMVYVKKILLEGVEQQEVIGYFDEINKGLTVGYRMSGYAYLESREEFDLDDEEDWEEKDREILKKAQENFYNAFKRGDWESFQPLYDITIELMDWNTMFEIFEKTNWESSPDEIDYGELLRKCTILSKNFEKGLELLEKGGHNDSLQKVKYYMETIQSEEVQKSLPV